MMAVYSVEETWDNTHLLMDRIKEIRQQANTSEIYVERQSEGKDLYEQLAVLWIS